MRSRKFGVPVVAVLGLLFGPLDFSPMIAQVKQGKSRPLLTKQLMKGLMNLHCGELKKALDAGPTKDEDWQDVELRAALINEASYILMEDGRCPDGTWADAATKKLRTGSGDVLSAAKEKNLENAKKAFGSMTGACKDCHTAHKKSQ